MSVTAANLELGPANVYLMLKVKATLNAPAASGNSQLKYTARKAGTAGNSITVEYAIAAGDTTVVVTGTAIKVTCASGTTADAIKNAVNANAAARALVTVTRALGSDGTGTIVGVFAATALSGGIDTETATDVGGLGDDLRVAIMAAAAPLTAAQTGSIPQSKVITGGSFQVTVPFKEITMDNFQRAFPNAVLFDSPNGLKRVDFISQVGQDMRDLAVKMEIRKIIGGGESALPEDILVIPSISPVDGEVALPYSPTDQRVIAATFEAWPDSAGRWAFFGDETL